MRLDRSRERGWDVKAILETGVDATVPATAARNAERDVCRWSATAIRDMTMAEAEAALAVDPLLHLDCGGHLGRVDVRYWYFRPELKYLTCRRCSEGGDPSAIEPEVVGCRHRMPTQ
jgi:hypothetical protein